SVEGTTEVPYTSTEVPSTSTEVPLGDNNVEAKGFDFLAPTTRTNSMRFYWEEVQALEIRLVLALGMFSGHSDLRINFSKQVIAESFKRRNSCQKQMFEMIDAHIGHIT
ncbi:hypothetical protein Tco_1423836, partial [Tanacetum coccineum]